MMSLDQSKEKATLRAEEKSYAKNGPRSFRSRP